MKRTTILWPELFENTSDDLYSLVEEEIERFPIVYDFNYGATFGILSVQVRSSEINPDWDIHDTVIADYCHQWGAFHIFIANILASQIVGGVKERVVLMWLSGDI